MSLQSSAVPAHTPAVHESAVVHASPSSHVVPSVTATCEPRPTATAIRRAGVVVVAVDRVASDARARLATVGLRTGITVVTGRPVGDGYVRARSSTTAIRRAGVVVVAVQRRAGAHPSGARIGGRARITVVTGRPVGDADVRARSTATAIRGADVVVVAVQRRAAAHPSGARIGGRARITVVTGRPVGDADVRARSSTTAIRRAGVVIVAVQRRAAAHPSGARIGGRARITVVTGRPVGDADVRARSTATAIRRAGVIIVAVQRRAGAHPSGARIGGRARITVVTGRPVGDADVRARSTATAIRRAGVVVVAVDRVASDARARSVQLSVGVHASPSSHVVPSVTLTCEHVPPLQLSVVQTLLSLQSSAAPPHTPAVQESAVVHASPSSHVVPSVTATCEHVPPLQLSVVQALLSLQSIGLLPTHAPDWQLSVCVQASPSSQVVPSATLTCEHVPPLQLSVVQALLSLQSIGLLPTQAPDWQLSVCVHASPSSQVVPSSAAGFEHRPVPGSQIPATWHESRAAQTTPEQRSVPAQTPSAHTSLLVAGFPSSQVVPFVSMFSWHEPAPSHVSGLSQVVSDGLPHANPLGAGMPPVHAPV